MGWGWNPIKAIGDAVGDIGEAIVDVADAAAEGVAHVADTASDVVGGAATVVNTVTGGLAEDLVEATDDLVFDAVDTMTGGLVDIDYDDGVFTASAGIEGVAHAGAEISQQGVRVESGSVLHDQTIGFTDDGLDVGVAAGIDGVSQHLPYSGLGVDLDTDGDIAIDAEAKGTVPTPWGIASGTAAGAVHQNDEGFVGYVDIDGKLILPDGDVVAGNLAVGYAENDQGSQFGLDVGGSYTSVTGYTVGGQLGYDRVETADGTVIEGLEASATAGIRGATHTIGHQSISIEPGTDSPAVPGQVAPMGPALGSHPPAPQDAVQLGPAPADQVGTPGPPPVQTAPVQPVPASPLPAEPVAAPVVEPTYEPPLADAVAAADQVESSVDDFFSDL